MSGSAARWTTLILWSWMGLAGANPLATPPSSGACAAPTAAGDRREPDSTGPLEAGRPPRLRVTLAWRDLTRSMAPLTAAVRQEVEQILAPLDVALDWRTVKPEASAQDDEISIIVLPRPRGALPARVMGAVNRRTKREAWIFLSGVKRLLTMRPAERGPAPVDPRELARLTGRVVAHELVHVIAPQLGHTKGGLMRAEWSRAVALEPHLDLDPRAARAFLTALDPALALCPPPRDDANGTAGAIAGESVSGEAVDLL